jgi:hypothetical protein
MSFILRFSLSGPASLLPSSLSLGHYGFSGCWFSFIIGAEFFVASPRKHVAGIVGDLAANARDHHGRSRQRWPAGPRRADDRGGNATLRARRAKRQGGAIVLRRIAR